MMKERKRALERYEANQDMTQEIAHQPCPYVECGSSDAFSFNTKGYGKCHSCHRSYPSKYQKFQWAAEKYPVPQGTTMTSPT